jgi:hypothetical protein
VIKSLLFIAAITLLSSCMRGENNIQHTDVAVADDTLYKPSSLSVLVTITDAEKIMGEPLHLTDSSTENKTGVVTSKVQYSARTINKQLNRPNTLYCMMEFYSNESSAKATYASIKKSNENHEGIKVLSGIGDEAYFHSDYENFYFILARKNNAVFRMKVSKITEKTSLPAFNAFAEKTVASL